MMKKLILIGLLLLSACSKKEFVPPASKSVYYEIFVASFHDSDGDGVGDIQGIIEKLDYIQKDLGASGIWLMPIHPSRSYHKYDVMDYRAVDPSYGTMEDLDLLIAEMSKRDMDLMLDLVINHSSNEHPWFLAAKEEKLQNQCKQYCDYYNFSDSKLPKYNAISDTLFYESGFSDTMPDLNLDNPKVRNEIQEITKFWIDKGIRGFRLDATTHFYDDDLVKNVAFLTWFTDYASSLNPEIVIVGEAWTDASIVQPMFASNASFFNFSLSQNSGRLVKDINRSNGYGLAQFMESYQTRIESFNPAAIDSIFFSNHDHGRSGSYFSNHLDKQKLAASVYLLLPGNVFIYYGEEIGMIGSGRDENKRLALPWGTEKGQTESPKHADYDAKQPTTVKEAMKDKDSLFNHYQRVLKIRNQNLQISRGKGAAVDLDNPALFAMKFEDLIVVHNFSQEQQSFTGSYEIVDRSLGGTQSKEVISLEAYSSVIIRIK